MNQPVPVTLADRRSDPAAYDVVQCDQFGIDHEGKPVSDSLTGTGAVFDQDYSHDGSKMHVGLSCFDNSSGQGTDLADPGRPQGFPQRLPYGLAADSRSVPVA